jgi:hypothetical protein
MPGNGGGHDNALTNNPDHRWGLLKYLLLTELLDRLASPNEK